MRRALEVAGDNIPVFASRAAAELAQLLIARGQLDEAETLLPQALAVGPPFCRFEALLAQAELAAARGDSDAQDLATSALDFAGLAATYSSRPASESFVRRPVSRAQETRP